MLNSKSVTLVELLIAISLLGVIILGVVAFELISQELFITSERKTHVLNELTYVLDHLHRKTFEGSGNLTNPAITWNGGSGTVQVNKAGIPFANYTFDNTTHKVSFNDGITAYPLTSCFINATGNFQVRQEDGGLFIDNLTFRYQPAADVDLEDNPQVSITEMFFFSPGQTFE